jgi:hypothetical protein
MVAVVALACCRSRSFTFDQLGFFTALHLRRVPIGVLYGGWIARWARSLRLMTAFLCHRDRRRN